MENAPKKQLPAYAVLTIIALIAALALAVTNMLTAGPIAQRQSDALRAAYDAVLSLPEGGVYEEITEGLENQDISSLYAAKDAQGNVIGYCVTASGKGYGGTVAVTLGVDTNGLVTGCVVGDTSFAESPGFGSRAKEPAFQDQFKGLSAVEGGSFEALTGATITSNAVLDAATKALTAVAQVGLKKDALPSPLLSFGVKAAPQVDTSALVPGATLRGTAEGYGGGIVTVTVTLDDSLAIAKLNIDASTQTPGIGTRCGEDADWQSTILGQTIPVSVDALSGATITSGAVQDAINGAEPYETEEASAPAPSVIAQSDDATLGVYSDGSAVVAPESGFSGSLNVVLDVVNGKVQSGTVETVKPAAESLPEDVLTSSAPGFDDDPVKVSVTLAEDGTIASLVVDAKNQMAGVGMVCEGEDFTSQFIGKKGPFNAKADKDDAVENGIDVCTGATYTSKGVIAAVNKLFADEQPAPADNAPLTSSAPGFDDDPVKVSVTLAEDGTIASLVVDAKNQMAGVGMVCEGEDFTSQFIGKKGPFNAKADKDDAVENGIDVCTGATYTSKGVIAAVNKLFADEQPAPADNAPLTSSAPGFDDDPVKVSITLSEDGTIASLVVDAKNQMAGVGMVCEGEDFTSQFIGKKGPFNAKADKDDVVENGIDVCSGATYTSKGVIAAVNKLFADDQPAPADNALLTSSAPGFDDDPVKVSVTLAEDGTIASLVVDAKNQMAGVGLVCEGEDFTSQFIGKKGPFNAKADKDDAVENGIDVCSGATYTSKGVIEAVNKLFDK